MVIVWNVIAINNYHYSIRLQCKKYCFHTFSKILIPTILSKESKLLTGDFCLICASGSSCAKSIRLEKVRENVVVFCFVVCTVLDVSIVPIVYTIYDVSLPVSDYYI